MLPARQQKVDFSKLSEEEKVQFRKYGRLPANKNVLSHRLKERKYFDSGDYALSKAGKTEQTVGEKHPSPESIPHHQSIPSASAVPPPLSTSPSATINVRSPAGPNTNPVHPSGLSPPSLPSEHIPVPAGSALRENDGAPRHLPFAPPQQRRPVQRPSGLHHSTDE